ncbi:hypothetical protein LOK49_LG05G02116 [Camellia lanceoleosa]|uniref:Uncharacterized protein n=1 Tax=Camellia lanceoleosa TaxID=1840588 RepID=A0ACC0HJG1_9ERIC|nr:hypothetical protein LOK49_LG05G02116 [Camellia lanceoleosa]
MGVAPALSSRWLFEFITDEWVQHCQGFWEQACLVCSAYSRIAGSDMLGLVAEWVLVADGFEADWYVSAWFWSVKAVQRPAECHTASVSIGVVWASLKSRPVLA